MGITGFKKREAMLCGIVRCVLRRESHCCMQWEHFLRRGRQGYVRQKGVIPWGDVKVFLQEATSVTWGYVQGAVTG